MMTTMAAIMAAPRSSSGGMGRAIRKARAEGYPLRPLRCTVSAWSASSSDGPDLNLC